MSIHLYNPTTKHWDIPWEGTGGAAIVHTDLAQGIIMGKRIVDTHMREIATLSTAQTLDWSATPVAGVLMVFTQEAAGTAELRASVAFCVDPPNDAIRDAFLTAGSSLAADSQRYGTLVNDSILLTFDGANISYLGIKRDYGSEALRGFAIGFEVEA